MGNGFSSKFQPTFLMCSFPGWCKVKLTIHPISSGIFIIVLLLYYIFHCTSATTGINKRISVMYRSDVLQISSKYQKLYLYRADKWGILFYQTNWGLFRWTDCVINWILLPAEGFIFLSEVGRGKRHLWELKCN